MSISQLSILYCILLIFKPGAIGRYGSLFSLCLATTNARGLSAVEETTAAPRTVASGTGISCEDQFPKARSCDCGCKVALLFLAAENVSLESIWVQWFSLAVGLVPRSSLRQGDAQLTVELVTAACRLTHTAQSVLQLQRLFNVYVHRQANAPELPVESHFRNAEISNRVKVEYAEHSIVEAIRQLIKEALENTSNIKFALLSDSCMPLYPPSVVYLQLVTEPKSRINACPVGDRQEYRYNDEMEQSPHSIRKEEWRYSTAWSSFRRDHAEAIAADVHFNKLFHMHCVFKQSGCLSDEHYIPSLLSKLGREDETDCTGLLTRDFFGLGYHPQLFEAPEINQELEVQSQYVNVSADSLHGESSDFEWTSETLGKDCPLFARKFPKRASERIAEVLFDCKNSLEFVEPCRDTS